LESESQQSELGSRSKPTETGFDPEIVSAEIVRSPNNIVVDAELVDVKSTASANDPSQALPTDIQLASIAAVEQADLVEQAGVTNSTSNPTLSQTNGPKPSWVFRLISFLQRLTSNLFGIASVIFLLAVTANIPILNFLSFGYLLEVTGRLARKQKFSDAMVGLRKASVLGSIVLGTWLVLWPLRLMSEIWFEAYLIAPNSQQTQILRVVQIVAIVLVMGHIAAAWVCGGKLRYFFWPIVAPFSFAVWLARRLAGVSIFRKAISLMTGWCAPRLVDDICGTPPIVDWFLPAIFLKRLVSGKLIESSRDAVWNFAASLNLTYYFLLGFKGFLGTFLWLLFPTALLVSSTYCEDGAAILAALLGVLTAIPVFAVLPFLQAHFATDGKLKRFIEVRHVVRNFGRAPWAHIVALLMAIVMALPLFVLKVEAIPSELLWSLSIVFVVFTWPAKMLIGWAYGRGAKREQSSRWWVRYPLLASTVPLALTFVLILMLTRYVSWNGAMSLFENHVFLLPAPFWQ
jgi:hypothetical protein